MTKTSLSLGPVDTGSLLSSSEGLSMTGMLTLVTTICTGDFDPALQRWAIMALGIAAGFYALSRGIAKRGIAKRGAA